MPTKIKSFLLITYCRHIYVIPVFKDNKSLISHKTVEIKIFLNLLTCWLKDLDPDLKKIITRIRIPELWYKQTGYNYKSVILPAIPAWRRSWCRPARARPTRTPARQRSQSQNTCNSIPYVLSVPVLSSEVVSLWIGICQLWIGICASPSRKIPATQSKYRDQKVSACRSKFVGCGSEYVSCVLESVSCVLESVSWGSESVYCGSDSRQLWIGMCQSLIGMCQSLIGIWQLWIG